MSFLSRQNVPTIWSLTRRASLLAPRRVHATTSGSEGPVAAPVVGIGSSSRDEKKTWAQATHNEPLSPKTRHKEESYLTERTRPQKKTTLTLKKRRSVPVEATSVSEPLRNWRQKSHSQSDQIQASMRVIATVSRQKIKGESPVPWAKRECQRPQGRPKIWRG